MAIRRVLAHEHVLAAVLDPNIVQPNALLGQAARLCDIEKPARPRLSRPTFHLTQPPRQVVHALGFRMPNRHTLAVEEGLDP